MTDTRSWQALARIPESPGHFRFGGICQGPWPDDILALVRHTPDSLAVREGAAGQLLDCLNRVYAQLPPSAQGAFDAVLDDILPERFMPMRVYEFPKLNLVGPLSGWADSLEALRVKDDPAEPPIYPILWLTSRWAQGIVEDGDIALSEALASVALSGRRLAPPAPAAEQFAWVPGCVLPFSDDRFALLANLLLATEPSLGRPGAAELASRLLWLTPEEADLAAKAWH